MLILTGQASQSQRIPTSAMKWRYLQTGGKKNVLIIINNSSFGYFLGLMLGICGCLTDRASGTGSHSWLIRLTELDLTSVFCCVGAFLIIFRGIIWNCWIIYGAKTEESHSVTWTDQCHQRCWLLLFEQFLKAAICSFGKCFACLVCCSWAVTVWPMCFFWVANLRCRES